MTTALASLTPEERERYDELIRLGNQWSTQKGLNKVGREALALRLVLEERKHAK